ncbi:MAG: hypothetical protein BAJATHORv1_40271 [Candidatus Thorarchaeota archaeon]|nr:MAG: hypothetical protein BAJATHORv1_40271 [Candidatus Thorarchaeota archaeon]
MSDLTEEIGNVDLIERMLLIATLNSTLIHFLITSQVEGSIDPDRVDSLTQGLTRTRSWLEDLTTSTKIPPSTQNIVGLLVKRLSQIESVLPKLSEIAKKAEDRGTPTAEILHLLDGGEGSRPIPKEVVKAASSVTTDQEKLEPLLELASPEPPEPKEPYKKVGVENDEWGLIGQTQRMIQQYSKRCHALLPTFWLEVLRELHRYESNSPYIGDAIEIPARVVVRIVKGLLTEAPGARLLQDLMKKRAQENYLDGSEMERVERAVSKYFAGIEGILKGEDFNVQEKILDAHTAFDGFGWGGPDLEKRLIKRINQRCEEALQNAETGSDPQRQVIYAEITKLLCKLQHAILAEPRLREILAQMKP